MSANNVEVVKKAIKITQIDSPHKFWYKNCNDPNQDRLIDELEQKLAAFANDVLTRNEALDLKDGDVVAAHHTDWNKWIRGKSGRKKLAKKDGEVDSIYIWAIDYGCKLLLPLKHVLVLNDMRLAYRRPINVHIGGISNVVPATHVCFDFIYHRNKYYSNKKNKHIYLLYLLLLKTEMDNLGVYFSLNISFIYRNSMRNYLTWN